jgi:hypothetical protein
LPSPHLAGSQSRRSRLPLFKPQFSETQLDQFTKPAKEFHMKLSEVIRRHDELKNTLPYAHAAVLYYSFTEAAKAWAAAGLVSGVVVVSDRNSPPDKLQREGGAFVKCSIPAPGMTGAQTEQAMETALAGTVAQSLNYLLDDLCYNSGRMDNEAEIDFAKFDAERIEPLREVFRSHGVEIDV